MRNWPSLDRRKRYDTGHDSVAAQGGEMGSAILAEASRLLADSIDYETTLATVARLALPPLGAWCIVDVVEDDSTLRRLAIVHPDPRRQALARRLQSGWPPRRDDPFGVPAVMLTREPEIIETVTDDLLRAAAHSEENLRILRRLGIGSLMVVPLIARGSVIGAMTFVGPAEGHRYTAADLNLARDLAARCAIAIDNARLYRDAQRARAAAEEASRAKSHLLAMMSHEIRTPINAIIGYTQLLEMGLDGPLTAEQRGRLERIQASSQYLLELINQILDIARLESGQLSVRTEPVDLQEVIDAAISIIQPQAASRSLQLDVAMADAAPGFIGDSIRTRQILVNLLVNACKFTSEGGRITVSADSIVGIAAGGRQGHWTRIHVADTGVGIPPEKLETVFEPFVQVSEDLARTEGGAGLGLTISRQLARMMGGDLTLESTPGVGSRFTLWLRAQDGNDGVAETGVDYPPGSDLRVVADLIMSRIVSIADRYVGRLRGASRAARAASDLELRDTAFNLLSGIAGVLATAAEYSSDGRAAAIRDGSTIQRVVSELHGAQRRRLGWSDEALARDYDLLEAAIIDELRDSAPAGVDIEAAAQLIGRVLEQAERASVRGWQAAEQADA